MYGTISAAEMKLSLRPQFLVLSRPIELNVAIGIKTRPQNIANVFIVVMTSENGMKLIQVLLPKIQTDSQIRASSS